MLLSFLKSLRLTNVFLIGLGQVLIFHLIEQPVHWSVVVMTALITAFSNFQNDYCDIKTDRINDKPNVFNDQFSRKQFIIIYSLFSLTLLFLWLIDTPNRTSSLIILGCWLILILYNLILQKWAIIGNIVVVCCSLLSFLLPFVATTTPIEKLSINLQSLLVYTFVSIAILQFTRELIKDVIDLKGDYNSNYKTLVIVLGSARVLYLSMTLLLIYAVITLYFLYWYPQSFDYTWFLIALGVLPLTLNIAYDLQKTNPSVALISKKIKVIIALGILSLLIYQP